VLEQIALRGGFQLRATGQLGLVTAAFDDLSLERALRRLVRDHELMLIYGGPADAAGEASLLEVAVFAAPPSRRVADRLGPAAVAQRAALLGEINRLARGGQDGGGTPRLAELLGAAPDPSVRAHAARMLGQVGGAAASAALAAALADQAPGVRVQVASSLRRLEGPRAIPALGRLLLGDPDVTVRRTAARLLDTMRDPAATAALGQAAGDPDAAVRHYVSRSLQRRAPPSAR
jgi:hypothetical protein